ncbi:ABC transporter ATP-binding protein [Aggregatilinea lenta]|uniref:ABC transporter ATP-binding protein n=1 Tax=Aggregatilinea lenta TaxID=913108 RepID=UPI001EE90C7B|nr:ABC transporter ATP-binding protein [Aggregatilinea lenta]
MQGITKSFPGVVANHNVTLDVEQGEIHALVGENGAGKSTLMKILYGMEKPDSGQIFLNEQAVSIPNPQAAIKLGIDMVHQHFQLVPSLTVAENVTLGYEPRRGMFVDRGTMDKRVRALSERFGLAVDPQSTVRDLSVGEQQRVEILKLLYRDARLLILDEPSAVLTPQEVDDLFKVLRRLVDEGRTAIFITHKLREVMTICQRATVLRHGELVGTVTVADTTPEIIAQMMVGRDLDTLQRTPAKPQSSAPLLAVRDVHATDDRGLPALNGVSFAVHAGEIVGLAGVEGNGQSELIEVLVGLRSLKQGSVSIEARDVSRASNRRRRELGMALIPEDRSHQGLSGESTLTENIVSTRYHRAPMSRGGVLSPGAMKRFAQDAIEQFDIRVRGPNVTVKTLSGGNAQKVVIARELAQQPTVLLAAQPTRGLDLGAMRYVHSELLRLRDAGTAILLISADLDELLAISDRFVVMFEGQIVGEMGADEATREKLGILMAGRASAPA